MTIYRKYTPTEIKTLAKHLNEQLAEGVLPEESLESVKFRGVDGKTWTVSPKTGRWYVSEAGSWQPAEPPDQPLDGSIDILDLVALPLSPLEYQPPEDQPPTQPEGDFREMIENAVRRVRKSYLSGRLDSSEAERLLKDLCLLDPAGLIWSFGMHSDKWYFFREQDWEFAEDQEPDPQDFELKPPDTPVVCSSCGSSLNSGKFCSECGAPAPVPEPSYSQVAIEVVERFTEADADPLPEPVVPVWEPAQGIPELEDDEGSKPGIDQTESSDSPPKKRTRLVILVFVLVFAVTCLCCLSLGLGWYFLME